MSITVWKHPWGVACLRQKKAPVKCESFLFADGRSRTGTWGEPRQILSLVRLPISPLRLVLKDLFTCQFASVAKLVPLIDTDGKSAIFGPLRLNVKRFI